MRFLLSLIAIVTFTAACGSDVAMPWDKKKDDKEETSTAPNGNQPRSDDGEAIMPGSKISNLATLIDQMNLASYHQNNYRGRKVKVAILDNGFMGLKESVGTSLPPDLKVPPMLGNAEADTNHGTKLAELVYALATGSTNYLPSQPGPTLLLYNTNGFTNLRIAVSKAIEEKVDIILYSQVWEYGGNFDGGGFINKEVNRAVDAGIVWINAAGNYGNATYNGHIEADEKGKVKLPYNDRYVRFEIAQDGTPVKIVLSWNDFTSAFEYRTRQNLDLNLETSTGRKLGTSNLVQDGANHNNADGYSDHAREIIRATLNKGTYYISVDAKSKNFTANSQMRVSVDGFGVRVLDQGEVQDSVMVPADNARVLTVGASDVDFTSWRAASPGRPHKPDVLTPSVLAFDNGETYAGSSTAAAVAAGTLAVYRSAFGAKSDAKLKQEINSAFIAKPLASVSNAEKKAPVLRLPTIKTSRN